MAGYPIHWLQVTDPAKPKNVVFIRYHDIERIIARPINREALAFEVVVDALGEQYSVNITDTMGAADAEATALMHRITAALTEID